jgi:hypothetical protein
MNITALFVIIDDFCKIYQDLESKKLLGFEKQRHREGYLSLSEALFIEIYYHFSGFMNFKKYYDNAILGRYKNCFKKIPSYERFIHLRQRLLLPLAMMLHCLKGQKTGHYYIDSTSLKVCHNKRISRHKVFAAVASRGKTSMGWFFGLKLHSVINDLGEIMAVKITSGHIDDRNPVCGLIKNLSGKLFGDKGYLSKKLFQSLYIKGLRLITGIRSNMKNYLMPFLDKIHLRKRFKIENIFGILKNHMDLEHSIHRSVTSSFVHILSTLTAFSLKPFLAHNILIS